MKNSSFFFGAFFLSAGIIWLDRYFDFLGINFNNLFKFWPLYLVFIGLSYLKLSKVVNSVISFLSGILTAVLIYSAVLYFIDMTEIERLEFEQKIEKKIEDALDKRDKI